MAPVVKQIQVLPWWGSDIRYYLSNHIIKMLGDVPLANLGPVTNGHPKKGGDNRYTSKPEPQG